MLMSPLAAPGNSDTNTDSVADQPDSFVNRHPSGCVNRPPHPDQGVRRPAIGRQVSVTPVRTPGRCRCDGTGAASASTRASHPAVTRDARRGGDRPSRTGPSTTPSTSAEPPNGASHSTHAPPRRTQPYVASKTTSGPSPARAITAAKRSASLTIRTAQAPRRRPSSAPTPTCDDAGPSPQTAVPRTLPSGASFVVKREQPQHPPGPTRSGGPAPSSHQSDTRGDRRRSATCTAQNTQIYEGTNQVQRIVMARQLLKGLPS